MSILCGTDFSESAAGASSAAAALAAARAEPLTQVHVLPEPLLDLPAFAVLHDRASQQLAEQAEELARRFAIAVEPQILQGSADERLIEAAQARGVSLLVVAALGGRQQSLWSLGSVAERVVQRSAVPVLVVRDSASIVAWVRRERALRVVLGIDLGQSSRAALRWVERLRLIGPCDVELVQVVWPVGEHARFGVKQPIELVDLRPELRALLERDLDAWVGTLQGDGEVSRVVSACWGRVDAHLAELAQQGRADLLVVGTHQRSFTARAFQGSVSRGALHEFSGNVVCVPAAAAAFAAKVQRFHSVLIATDLSPLGNEAIVAGYGLVAPGGVVHLLHVAEANEHELLGFTRQLSALVPTNAAELAVTTELHVPRGGEPWSVICQVAARLGVDAVCLSTHARGGVSHALLGSQAEQVLRAARVPVLLVTPKLE